MDFALAIVAGASAGIFLSLVPGLHVGLVILFLVASKVHEVVGVGPSACFIAATVGASMYTKCLGTVYHPSAAGGDPSTLEPALAMTREGRGPDAFKIMVFATDVVWLPVAAFAFVLAFLAAFGFNGARLLDQTVGWVGVPVILAWALYTCWRSKNPATTALSFGLSGLYGYVTLNHSVLANNEHTMSVLMAGKFGIPIMLAALLATGGRLGAQAPSLELLVDGARAVHGALAGLVTGFLAGLGAGSLVTMIAKPDETREDYLVLSRAGEAANDLMAIVLVLVAGMGRSGEAVMLGRVTGRSGDFLLAAVVAGALAIGAVFGRDAARRLEQPYLRFVSTPVVSKLAPVLVLALAVWQVSLVGHWLAYLLCGVGVITAILDRQNEVPLQVSFGCLALPLVVQSTGLAPWLNRVLFG